MTSMMSAHQFLDKHAIFDMFFLKWTSHRISHLRFRLGCDIALEIYSRKSNRRQYIFIEDL